MFTSGLVVLRWEPLFYMHENAEAGRGLLLKGSVGTMKTTLAVAVLQEQIAQGGSGYFVTMSGLLDSIFTLKAISPGEWARFEQRLRETPLLVLDDLGAEHSEGWVQTKVDAIIAERYNRCWPVIVTTNLTAGQLRGIAPAPIPRPAPRRPRPRSCWLLSAPPGCHPARRRRSGRR